MLRYCIVAICLLMSVIGLAQTESISSISEKVKPSSIDEKINAGFRPVADFIGGIVFYSISIGDEINYSQSKPVDGKFEYFKETDSTTYKTSKALINYRKPANSTTDLLAIKTPGVFAAGDSIFTLTYPNGRRDTVDAATFAAAPDSVQKESFLGQGQLTKAAELETKTKYTIQVAEDGEGVSKVQQTKLESFHVGPFEMVTSATHGTAYQVKYIDDKRYTISFGKSEDKKFADFTEEEKAFFIEQLLGHFSAEDRATIDEKTLYPKDQNAEYAVAKNVSYEFEFGKESKILLAKGDAEKGTEDKFFTFTINNKSGNKDTLVQTIVPTQRTIPIVLIVLLLGALFFTIYFKFPNITRLGLAINTVRGKYYDAPETKITSVGDKLTRQTVEDDIPETIANEEAEGEVTPFQALTAALSATVGLGNIAGVAIALSIGGPGATFWMIVAGLLGMSSKFVECTLGVKYREIGQDGTVHGGPMYYLSKGLKERGMGWLGKIFAVFFAIMCVGGSFGGGNMFQANQAAEQFKGTFGFEGGSSGFIFGIVIMVLVGIVIIGGIKRIGKVTEKVVPFMAALYIGAALIVIFTNVGAVPEAFGLIFSSAFSSEAATGGFVGVLIAGFQRAAFSNEAGVGSAAIAHSAVRTKHPASEGMVALLEPFIDTVVICTMTALVVIITNIEYGFVDYGVKVANGVEITSTAFDSSIPGFSYLLTVAVILFAFSTMLSWSYYGLQAWKYLFGKSKAADLTYKLIFCAFVIIGASASLGAVVDFSDAMIFAMVFPNVIGLFLLAPVVSKEVKKYVDFTKTYKKSEDSK
ncbi:MAG: alanine:cation symporter family protein [Saprospiraceae bacterium]|nr:alanine:cation symporter family protein [Saprospiraceae bacterium]